MKKIMIVLLAFVLVLSSCGTLTYTGNFCEDGMKDRDETDVDCGGQYCRACLNGMSCDLNEDCESSICDSTTKLCAGGTGSAVDTDGDGYTDQAELIAGTDASDADSHPCSSITDCSDSYTCHNDLCEFLTSCGDGICGFYETYNTCSADCEQQSVSLADYPDFFINDDNELTAELVVGEDAMAEDVIAITSIATSLSVSAVKLDNEISDVHAQDLILVGTQCANDVINEVLGLDETTCATSITQEDTAIIKLIELDTNKILILSGYAPMDTRVAAQVLTNYGDYALEGDEIIVDTSDTSNPVII